jgi:hypothetical protein
VAPNVPAVSVAAAYRPAADRWSLEEVAAGDGGSAVAEGAPLIEV